MSVSEIKKRLRMHAREDKREFFPKFFQAFKGGYGEGDKFLGVMVPDTRKIAKSYKDLPYEKTIQLLHSPFHEERLCALFILIHKFEKGDERLRQKIYKTYLENTKYINNWDLIDTTVHKIVGKHLFEKDRKPLYRLARSKDLWKKRISIIATYEFIRHEDLDDTYAISDILLQDDHDLIHKGVGWMIREAGKRDPKRMKAFLKTRYQNMPRTMLRYAIEKLPEAQRKKYLKGQI